MTRKNLREERLGAENYNKNGRLMKVIEYNKTEDIVIEFPEDGMQRRTSWSLFSKGEIKHPDDKRKNIKELFIESKRAHEENKVGMENVNNQGCLMRIIQYNTYSNIIVEFQDEYKFQKRTCLKSFLSGNVFNPNAPKNRDPRLRKDRVGTVGINKQGSKMKVISYNSKSDIIVEFQDKYKVRVHTEWRHFIEGNVKNPYAPSVLNVGITGAKYPVEKDGKTIKEYIAWYSIILRSYDKDFKEYCPTYENVTVCDEWLLYENFYEWLHSQENFQQWYDGHRWEVDKDIIVKRNKVYSPDTCCLVPHYINTLFVKRESSRGDLPIGVSKDSKSNRYQAITIYGRENNKSKTTLYYYSTPEDAFYLGYKPSKEAYIKRVAQEEYNKGNITERCYNAMMNYKVEITD